LESIAIALSIEKLVGGRSKNYLVFQMGGGTTVLSESRPFLNGAIALARKHSQLQLHVDSHVAIGAPTYAVLSCSLDRCCSAIHACLEKGIDKKRLSFRPWGKKVTLVWSEPQHLGARAELFFRFDGKECPERPPYYDLVQEEDWPEEEKPCQMAAFDTYGEKVERIQENVTAVINHIKQRAPARRNKCGRCVSLACASAAACLRKTKDLMRSCFGCPRVHPALDDSEILMPTPAE
jgi:hypothetical protein